MTQDIHFKVIFFIKNISTSRFSWLIINPKLSIVTLKFAHISKSRLAVPRHSRTNDSDYHKDTLPAPTGHMKTINYLYTLAPPKNKILMKPKQCCNLFSLSVLPWGIIPRQPVTSFSFGGIFQLKWFWFEFKIFMRRNLFTVFWVSKVIWLKSYGSKHEMNTICFFKEIQENRVWNKATAVTRKKKLRH